MKNVIVHGWNQLSRFEKTVLAGTAGASLIAAVVLFLFAVGGDSLVKAAYEERLPAVFNRVIQVQDSYPLQHYLALKTDIALHLLMLWAAGCALGVPSILIVYRFFFSDRPVRIGWLIFVCCLSLVLLFAYNFDLKINSVHTFFYTGPVYQILNGNVPPMDPLFGGEILHYQWGHGWAAAMLSKLVHVTPFSSFLIINVLSLAGCLWLLYRISFMVTASRSVSVFCSFFVIYCGTILNWQAIADLHRRFPFYLGEDRVFPLLVKFVNNNAATFGLFFFLLAAWGTLKLFERRKTVLYSLAVLAGAVGTLFFYTAYGPGMLAWVGCIGLWVVICKRGEFASYGRTLGLLCALMVIVLAVMYPYLRQISSSGGYLRVELFNLRFATANLLHFLVPTFPTLGLILIFRKHIVDSVNRQHLALLGCLFVSNMGCYILFHFPSSIEYKFMLLALVPFGLVGGIALARLRHYSRWAALGLFALLCLPSVQLYLYQFSASPRTVFDVHYTAPFYENGMALERRDPEENELYQWIRRHTSTDRYFADRETRVPVYAQRSLWVAFETGKFLPGYAMSATRIKDLHGYDQQEFDRRQQVVQNLYGSENTLTAEEIAVRLAEDHVYVIVRNDNLQKSLAAHGFEEVFVSETARFRVLVPAADLPQ